MRILVIDDDPYVLRALKRALRHHVLITAEKALDALTILGNDHAFDAIMCDLHMPGMSGAEFYAAVGRWFPKLVKRVIFMTGGAYTHVDAKFLDSHRDVAKPFAFADLERNLLWSGAPPSSCSSAR